MDLVREVLPIWGGILSTILALLKFGEVWAGRRKFEISYNFRGTADLGNDITIRNLSAKPIVVTYWEVCCCKKRGFKWVVYDRVDEEGEINDIFIQGYSSKTLQFTGVKYFEWKHDQKELKRIYFKFYIGKPSVNPVLSQIPARSDIISCI